PGARPGVLRDDAALALGVRAGGGARRARAASPLGAARRRGHRRPGARRARAQAGDGAPVTTERLDARPDQVAQAVRLEIVSLGWSVVEAVVALVAAASAGSVALLGFGLDSVVESASAGVLLWRLLAERAADRRGATLDHQAIARLDRRAHRLVAATLFALAAWIAGEALWALWTRERPAPSLLGIARSEEH